VAGLPVFVLLRAVWAEPLAMAAGLFVLFATFGLVQIFRDHPGLRRHWGIAVSSVLAAASLGVVLTMVVAYAVAYGMEWMVHLVDLRP